MSTAIEDLKAFIARVGTTYAATLEVVGPGDDPVPTLIVENADEQNVVMLPQAGEQDTKDLLFGNVFPDIIDLHDGKMVAFMSFAWLTEIDEEERERVKELIAERGIETRDSATIRSLLEEIGVEISGPDRRKEVCQMVACSRYAEAMIGAYVTREDDDPPRIEWDYRPLDPSENRYTGMAITARGSDEQHMTGRVIEGIRAGLDRVQAREDDWRTDD